MEQYFAFGHVSFVQMERTKVLRLTSLVSSKSEPNFESIEDSVRDLIAYAVFHLDYATTAKNQRIGSDLLESVSNRFHAAKNRCTNSKHVSWKYYGGRGILFKLESVDQLLKLLGPCPEGFILDRIDNDGHYEPGNIRWVSPLESNKNKAPRAPGKSGVKGVAVSPRGWQAYSDGNANVRKKLYEGPSFVEAVAARKLYEETLE